MITQPALEVLSLEEESIDEEFLSKFHVEMPKEQILSFLSDPPAGSLPQSAYGDIESKTDAFREPEERPLVLPRIVSRVRDRFISLQKWEGVVCYVNGDSFVAKLTDLTRGGPDEEAEFPLDEISEEDRKLVKPGAVFYWNIGYHDLHRGQRIRSSLIRFRRLPAWTKKEIESARKEAERISNLICWR